MSIPYGYDFPCDTNHWSVLSPIEREKRNYGNYTIWWRTDIVQNAHSSYSWSNRYQTIVVVEKRHEDGTTVSTDYKNINDIIQSEPAFYAMLEDEAVIFEKNRVKQRAADRKALNEAEAKELGITVKELIALRKEQRLKEKEEEVMTHTIEQINLLTKVSGQLKRLVEDVEALEKVIQSDPSKLNIHSVDNYIRNIRKARNVLRVWSRRKRVSLYDTVD